MAIPLRRHNSSILPRAVFMENSAEEIAVSLAELLEAPGATKPNWWQGRSIGVQVEVFHKRTICMQRTHLQHTWHMKGLKPSKPWILKKLEEEDTEDEVQQLDGTDIGDGSFADTEKMLNQWDSSVPHHGSIPHQGSIPSRRPENILSVDGSGILATTEGNGASDEVKELSTGGEKGGK